MKLSSKLSIYVDGLLQPSIVPISGTTTPSMRTLRIGSTWGGNAGVAVRDVNGLVDDVRIYDHALSASEVRSLAVPEPGSFAFLVAVGSTVVLPRRRAS